MIDPEIDPSFRPTTYESIALLRSEVAELRSSVNSLIHESRLVRHCLQNLLPPVSGDLSSLFSKDEP